jgi:hypothetical protein
VEATGKEDKTQTQGNESKRGERGKEKGERGVNTRKNFREG